MARNETTSKVIDEVLRFGVSGSVLAAGLLMPNLLIALEKPLEKYLKHLDKRDRERKARQVIEYMKSQGYLSGDYEHGLRVSYKGRKRLLQRDFEQLAIEPVNRWDHMWRLVFYDIPESRQAGRKALASKLRELGFFQLQRSVWIHPLPCRDAIETIGVAFGLERYISYVETSHIDNDAALIKRFQKRLSLVSFK